MEDEPRRYARCPRCRRKRTHTVDCTQRDKAGHLVVLGPLRDDDYSVEAYNRTLDQEAADTVGLRDEVHIEITRGEENA